MSKDHNYLYRLLRKRTYLSVLLISFRIHGFHLKTIHLVVRIANKKECFLESSIETNRFLIHSLSKDIKQLSNLLEAYRNE